MSRKGILTLVVLALLLATGVVIGVVFWPAIAHPVVRSFTMADGTTATLLRVTYGTNHQVAYGTGWRDRVAPYVPERFWTNLGLQVASIAPATVYNGISGAIGPKTMVVWVEHPGATPLPITGGGRGRGGGAAPFPRVRMSVMDDNGLMASTSMRSWNGTLMAFSVATFPARSRMLHLRIWDSSVSGPTANQPVLADLRIPNPAYSTAAPWTPEALPATRETNGLKVTLEGIETGYSLTSLNQKLSGISSTTQSRATSQDRTYSLATFDVLENGQPTTDWNIQQIQLVAPTGVAVSTRGSSSGRSSRGSGKTTVQFPMVMWPEEPAWELSAELVHTANFADNEIWTIHGIPLPETGENIGQAIATNVNGARFTFMGLRQNGAVTFIASGVSSFGGSVAGNRTSANQISASVVAQDVPSNLHLTLVKVVPDYGTAITSTGSSTQSSSPRGGGRARSTTYNFSFTAPDNANCVDITFAISQGRQATFRVKPTLVN